MALVLLISCSEQHAKESMAISQPLPRESPVKEIQPIKETGVQTVDLKTEDNINIKGTFYKGNQGMPSLILLHMLDRTRNDWDEFAKKLQDKGYNAIAIDFRGHGQSDLNWKGFSEQDFGNMALDVKAAKKFLDDKKLGNNVGVIGASIGANNAINYAFKDNSIKTAALLSPGLNYRGVFIEYEGKQYIKPVLIMASEDDTYSADSSKTLNSFFINSKLKLYSGSLHGTNLLGNYDADDLIFNWIDSNLK